MNRTDEAHLFKWVYPSQSIHQKTKHLKLRSSLVTWELRVRTSYEQSIILGTKWVAVARIGPILWEIEATGSGKVLRYVPGMQNIKIGQTNTTNIENREIDKLMEFRRFPIYSDIAWFGVIR